jgi:group I intron endonuclease
VNRINSNKSEIVKIPPYVIYQIINNNDGKFYIGSSVNYKSRWAQHIHLLNKNKHSNRHLQNAWNKHGGNNFEFNIIIELFTKENIQEIEQNYINFYFKYFRPKLYNIADKVVGHSNYIDVSGEKNPKAKLTSNEVLGIRNEYLVMEGKIGEKYKFLASKYDVSKLTISRIIRKKLWINI